MVDAMEGGGRWRSGPLRRVLSGIAEAARERAVERRARTAAREGEATRFPRNGLAAALEARAAVRAGVRLDDFLRRQLAQYATRLPVPLEELPISVEVTGGEAVVRARGQVDPRAARLDAGARAAPEAPLAAELRAAEAALSELDVRASRARERLDAAERDLVDAIATGRVITRASVDATPEQLGRPAVPPPWPVHAARAFTGALLATEAWRFAGPALAGAGFEPSPDLVLRTAPVSAGFALAFAAGAAATAFLLAGAALGRLSAMAPGAEATRRRALAATAAGAIALVGAVALAGASHQAWAQHGLLALVPFAGAALWRAADALALRRAAALGDALAWDRARAVEALERGRREEVILRAAAELDEVVAERAAAAAALRNLRRAAVAAERSALLEARASATRLDRLSEGLACALELDRYLYLRLAAAATVTPLPTRPRVDGPVGAERLGVAG